MKEENIFRKKFEKVIHATYISYRSSSDNSNTVTERGCVLSIFVCYCQMSRMLAAKAALAIRVDALGEDTNVELGMEHRAMLERRMRALEEGKVSDGACWYARFARFESTWLDEKNF